jgi:hypothetical protein
VRDSRFRDPPSGTARSARGRFPFPGHRTCDKWAFPRELPPVVRTDKDRKKDAERGSAQLCAAIKAAVR